MLILKAYKFRLEPTEEQSPRLRQLCGCARFVWDHGLEVTKHILDSGGKLPSAFELNRMLTGWKKTPEYAFLQEAYTDNLQPQEVNGKIKNATISQSAGQWYVSFQIEIEAAEPHHENKQKPRDDRD